MFEAAPFDLHQAMWLRQRHKLSAQDIAQALTDAGTPVSASTVRRRLIAAGGFQRPPEGRPQYRRMQVKGAVQDGQGFAVFKRTTLVWSRHPGTWSTRKSRSVTVHWPQCPLTTPASCAAVAVMVGLHTAPPHDRHHIKVVAPAEALDLVTAYDGTSGVLPEVMTQLAAPPPSLRPAQLWPSSTPTQLPIDPRGLPLEAYWSGITSPVAYENLSAGGTDDTWQPEEPQAGAWVVDYGERQSGGVAAFFRLTALPLALTPVYAVRLEKVASSSEGELTGALLAHAMGRIMGEEKPVVHTDMQGAPGFLRRNPLSPQSSPLFQQLMNTIPPQEVELRWTPRTHPAISHCHAAAAISLAKKGGGLPKGNDRLAVKALTSTLDTQLLAQEIEAFYLAQPPHQADSGG